MTKDMTLEQIIENMSLMDDDLFGLAFDGNIPATEFLLKTILDRSDIKVVSVDGQKELRNANIDGRKIRLDILVVDEKGCYYNCEVQRKNSGASEKRARFHSSMVDIRMLKKGQAFEELNDSYVIFITEKDYFKRGMPLYTVNRHFEEFDEKFEDGSHIIYVNGSYDGNDALGQLMRDFRCTNAKDINNPDLAKSVKYFKETEGGKEIMCESVERYADQKAMKATIQTSLELGAEKAKIITILCKNYTLTEEEAEEVYCKYVPMTV